MTLFHCWLFFFCFHLFRVIAPLLFHISSSFLSLLPSKLNKLQLKISTYYILSTSSILHLINFTFSFLFVLISLDLLHNLPKFLWPIIVLCLCLCDFLSAVSSDYPTLLPLSLFFCLYFSILPLSTLFERIGIHFYPLSFISFLLLFCCLSFSCSSFVFFSLVHTPILVLLKY
jgi:hypothetical protein